MLTEFTKTKISFMLALLGALFALHPLIDRFSGAGFDYLGVRLQVIYAYALTAGLLSAGVYCYGVALMSERPHSWLERVGNTAYALAIIVPPLFAGLYLASVLAHKLDQSHLAWAAPAVALGMGACWLLLSQAAALVLRRRLGEHDRQAKFDQLAKQEILLLDHARDLLESQNYDLSVIEAFKALETRLRRVFLLRRLNVRDQESMDALVRRGLRQGVLHPSVSEVLTEVERSWRVAMGSEPITKDAALRAVSGIRHVLATIPLVESDDEAAGGSKTPRDPQTPRRSAA
jgi:hypothetical protein